MKHNIFISYSHKDANLVVPIVGLLRATTSLIYLDSDSIKPGKKWEQEIIDTLEIADLVVVFWCKHSSESMEIKKEYSQAISANIDVLPVLLDSCPLPHSLAKFQWIDFRDMFPIGHDLDRQLLFAHMPPNRGLPLLLLLSIIPILAVGSFALMERELMVFGFGVTLLGLLVFSILWYVWSLRKRYIKSLKRIVRHTRDSDRRVQEGGPTYEGMLAIRLLQEMQRRISLNTGFSFKDQSSSLDLLKDPLGRFKKKHDS